MAGSAFAGYRALILGASAAGVAVARAYAPYAQHGPVLCPVRALFGIPCPGCGMTRALCALAQGDVSSALAFHAVSLPLALFVIAACAVAALELARGRAFDFYSRWLTSAPVWIAVLALWLTYHVGRIAYWAHDGTLLREYFRASWTYAVLNG